MARQEKIHSEITRLFGKEQFGLVNFVKRTEETPDTYCLVYRIKGEEQIRDLGVIVMEPGAKTPLQRVIHGDRTVEGFVTGKGTLTIIRTTEEIEVYQVDESRVPFSAEVKVGDLMQWQAAPDSKLVAFEICYPPYQEKRFENLPE